MRVLIVKMSSMGDVLHTLPALTDAVQHVPGISFDWLVEPDFQEIPTWHPAVNQVITMPLRGLKKNYIAPRAYRALWQAIRTLRQTKYDLIIDAQGLLKSSILATCARGNKVGYAKASAREPLASLFYQQRFDIAKEQHAITRTRQLFSKALNYSIDRMPLAYGLTNISQSNTAQAKPYVMFLHGTSWCSKEWPDQYWLGLAKQLDEKNIEVQLTWGTPAQRQRAVWLGRQADNVRVLPQLTLKQAAEVIQGAQAVVAVDTGFAHMAAAFEKPMVAIYGATDAKKTGVLGAKSKNLQATKACSPCLKRDCPLPKPERFPPCYQTFTPEVVFAQLEPWLLKQGH